MSESSLDMTIQQPSWFLVSLRQLDTNSAESHSWGSWFEVWSIFAFDWNCKPLLQRCLKKQKQKQTKKHNTTKLQTLSTKLMCFSLIKLFSEAITFKIDTPPWNGQVSLSFTVQLSFQWIILLILEILIFESFDVIVANQSTVIIKGFTKLASKPCEYIYSAGFIYS